MLATINARGSCLIDYNEQSVGVFMRCALLDLVAEPEPHPSSLASETGKALKCKPSVETCVLARGGFHVKAKLRKTAYVHSLL